MATYYVSNTASNGYVVGADTDNGTAKATPFLTIKKAIGTNLGAGVMASGDTCFVNDGTYLEDDYVKPGQTNLTLSAQNSGLAIVQANAAGSRVLHVQSTAGGL